MILALALFLAVLFGGVGFVTGHLLAQRQAQKEIAAASWLHAQAIRLAHTVAKSPAASLDPEAAQQASQLINNPGKDLTN
jgi:uncharacterized protein YneF (UPF0154 family)